MKIFDFTEVAKQLADGSDDPHEIISARNRAMDQEFPKAVRSLGWHLLRRGDLFQPNESKVVLVVVVAVWSNPDMLALDALATKIKGQDVDVFIVNIDDYPGSGELLKLLPGIKLPLQTPVLAKYEKGQLTLALEGFAAITWMKNKKKIIDY